MRLLLISILWKLKELIWGKAFFQIPDRQITFTFLERLNYFALISWRV